MAGWLSTRESIYTLTQNKGNFSVCTVNVDTPEDQLQICGLLSILELENVIIISLRLS
jgi:hypothetical protein